MITNTMPADESQPSPPRQTKIRRVHVEFIDPMAVSVCIAGTFNDWRPAATPMIHLGAGRWVKDLVLPPGVHEYRLVVDGCNWMTDPRASETAPNPFGGLNVVLRVAAQAFPKSSSQSRRRLRSSA